MVTPSSIIQRSEATVRKIKNGRERTTASQHLHRGIRSDESTSRSSRTSSRKPRATGSHVAAVIKARRLDSDSEEGSSESVRAERLGRDNDGDTSERACETVAVERERSGAGERRAKRKKRGTALRSASRCRVHRFLLPSTTLDTPNRTLTLVRARARTHAQACTHKRPISRSASVKGHADVRACQIIICNCRAG